MTTLPSFLCGGIDAGEWPKMKAKSFARALYLSRANNMVLEAMAPCYDPSSSSGYNDKNLNQIYKELSDFIKPILALKDLWVTLHLTNGNDETLTKFGAMNVANIIVGGLVRDFGANSNIIICPVAETNNEINERQFVQYCIDNWANKGGHLIFNGTGRPTSLPPSYSLLDYHSQSRNDCGPKIGRSTLIDTDNGPMINYLKYGAPAGKYWNPDRVRDLAIACKQVGNSLNLYSCESSSNNGYALDILGEVYNVRKKPNWWDKLMMEIKLWKY